VSGVNITCHTVDMGVRPYHHGDLGPALLDEALAVVKETGIATMALRDLTRQVGVSASAAYRHFPSRDHLVAAVSQRAREAMAATMITARDAISATGTHSSRSVRRFRAIGRAYIEFALHEPRLFEAAFIRCAVRPDRPDDPDAWGLLVASIEEMAATGAIPAAHRAEAPLVAWSGVHGLATIFTTSASPPDPTTLASSTAAIDTICDAIIRSLRTV